MNSAKCKRVIGLYPEFRAARELPDMDWELGLEPAAINWKPAWFAPISNIMVGD